MTSASIKKFQQSTLQRAVSCCGVGLHTGRTVNLTISPAPVHTGLRFVRSDLAGQPVIPALVDRVVDTTLATTIGEGKCTISTTEHLLAALRGYGIDNALIDLDSHEVPVMDGSADPFIRLLKTAGRRYQEAPRKMLRILQPVSYVDGEKTMRIEPYNGFRVSARIQFDDALISDQSYSVDVTPERFSKEIAQARTFGFVEQVEQLWQKGLALGGTLDNVIAIHWNRRSILNENGLRFDDEFIRHKVLDIIGDMTLLGAPLLGHVIADRSGHALHRAFMQTLINNPQAWEYVTCGPEGHGVQAGLAHQGGGKRVVPLMPSTSAPQGVPAACAV